MAPMNQLRHVRRSSTLFHRKISLPKWASILDFIVHFRPFSAERKAKGRKPIRNFQYSDEENAEEEEDDNDIGAKKRNLRLLNSDPIKISPVAR